MKNKQWEKEFNHQFVNQTLDGEEMIDHWSIIPDLKAFISSIEDTTRSQTRKECVEKTKRLTTYTFESMFGGEKFIRLTDAIQAIQGEEE